jgi:hypothetical protein
MCAFAARLNAAPFQNWQAFSAVPFLVKIKVKG